MQGSLRGLPELDRARLGLRRLLLLRMAVVRRLAAPERRAVGPVELVLAVLVRGRAIKAGEEKEGDVREEHVVARRKVDRDLEARLLAWSETRTSPLLKVARDGLVGAARGPQPARAALLPGLRSWLRRGAQCLQVGCGGPGGVALREDWRHFKPAGSSPGKVVV